MSSSLILFPDFEIMTEKTEEELEKEKQTLKDKDQELKNEKEDTKRELELYENQVRSENKMLQEVQRKVRKR